MRGMQIIIELDPFCSRSYQDRVIEMIKTLREGDGDRESNPIKWAQSIRVIREEEEIR